MSFLVHTFFTTLDSFGPFGPKPHLAVALSGGADSMACALLAHAWARAQGGHITTLTVDHGLRPESRAEAEQVAAWMHAHGIAHHILTPPTCNATNNLQENARTRRYDALATWCRAHGVLHCLLGHHAGDQRETVAHNIARGDTEDGASGMSAVRNYHGVRFLRPLLRIERMTLESYLQNSGIVWIEDPSNRDATYARVRTRHALVADTARRRELGTIATGAARNRMMREQALAHAMVYGVVLHPDGHAELSLAAWQQLEPTLAAQLLADTLRTLSGKTTRPRKADTLRLCAALRSPDFRGRTLHHCHIRLHHAQIRITREATRSTAPFTPLKPLAAAPFWWLN